MTKREIFYVGRVEPVGEAGDLWLVGGRAYKDLQMGDLVQYENVAETAKYEPLIFRIEGFTSYGKELSILSGGMTGNLLLRGQHGDLIRQNETLCAG